MRPVRLPIALMASMLAVMLAASTAGAFHEAGNTGTTGLYTVPDSAVAPGVVCRYENNAGKKNDEIDRIAAQPMWTHGPFATKTWVGQRILVKRNAKPHGDGTFKTVHRSPIVKGKANDSEIFTFPRRFWSAPEGSKAQYRAQVIFTFYAQGSKTNVIGKARGLIEVYDHQMAPRTPFLVGTEGGPAGWCLHNVHAPV